MLLLHLDTTRETACLALSEGEHLLGFRLQQQQRDHAAWLHTAIQELLTAEEKNLQACEALVVAVGPGSYTGIRVGVAAAKGLAFALQLPVIPLNTLDIIAHSLLLQSTSYHGAGWLVAPMLDARRQEVFTALYNAAGERLMEPTAMILDANSFQPWLDKHPIVFGGSGAAKWQAMASHSNAHFQAVEADPEALVSLGWKRALAGVRVSAAELQAEYLKPVYITPTTA